MLKYGAEGGLRAFQAETPGWSARRWHLTCLDSRRRTRQILTIFSLATKEQRVKVRVTLS